MRQDMKRAKCAKNVSWSRLPEDCAERVLSFLPVPTLFRCRSVCKRWNELVDTPSFRQLCDLNGKNKRYLFITQQFTIDAGYFHPIHRGSTFVDGGRSLFTCFLDLDEQRWYLMPVYATFTQGYFPRLLAMNDGLICGVCQRAGVSFVVVIFDPIADTRRELPADGRLCEDRCEPPVVVPVVDDYESRSFKVFLVDRSSILMNKRSGFFVYESSTNAWRALENPPLGLWKRSGLTPVRRIEESVVFFQGNLYAIFWHYSSSKSFYVVASYNLEENLWRKQFAMDGEDFILQRRSRSKTALGPQLVVSGSRLFLAVWVDAPRPEGQDSPDCLLDPLLVITEISVNENRPSRSIVKITEEKHREICSEPLFDISFGFPLDSKTLILFSRSTGKLMVYDLSSGSVIHTLPAHPLRESNRSVMVDKHIFRQYSAHFMNLSLGNILSGGPVPNRSHA